MRAPSPWRSRALGSILAGLAIAVVAVTVLERRGAVRESEIVEYAQARRTDAVALVRDLARSRPVVVLGDVSGASGPKRVAAEVIAELARGPGLDYVALEVGSHMQPVIDRYLDNVVDDASALVAQSAGTRHGTPAWLDLYRRVRELNRELGVDRRIRIVAIDAPDWPPAGAVAPSRLLPLFAARDEHMMRLLSERIFDREEMARVLVFVDGLRAMNASLRLGTRGSESSDMPLLARRLRAAQPGRVAGVLVDAPASAAGSAWVGYRGSILDRLLRAAAAGSSLAIPVRSDLPVTIDDIMVSGPPGLDIGLLPQGARLSELVDGYIRLPR